MNNGTGKMESYLRVVDNLQSDEMIIVTPILPMSLRCSMSLTELLR